MQDDPFRATRGPNESTAPSGLPDWGVYDARVGRVRGERIYTKAFADILAASMNWAYHQGRRDK